MRKKLARIQKLIKLRERSLQAEVTELNARKARLAKVSDELEAVQGQYFGAIDTLNRERENNPHRLRLWEDGVDCYKQRLQETMAMQKSWQDQVQRQLGVVLEARVAVQSLEKLAETYRHQWRQLQDAEEQSEQDQFSVLGAAGNQIRVQDDG